MWYPEMLLGLSLVFLGLFQVSDGLPTYKRSGYRCNENEIYSCLGPISSMVNPLQTDLAAIGKGGDMNGFCLLVSDAQKCINNKLVECYNKNSDLAVQTLNGILGYLCGDGRQVFQEEAKCWDDPDFKDGMAHCQKIAQRRISSSTIIADRCDALVNLNDCLGIMTGRVCNRQAGEFMMEMIYRGLKPAKKFMGCSFGFRLGCKYILRAKVWWTSVNDCDQKQES
ncbi:hypothetical protein LOTGIDRAFT_164330 [Lottia gigantea]|uniref:DUF19 domain-containing protein n=1 Tax=Lottia gigantea TaxID=225164 RepID=V4A5Z2_LOTGI|nr:hypothetical protein LOTGIDRAFT_164330 [Lottia gigantea]ESO90400.1 hypothetical protein LOTGIDRAFT_164330 [Lottia gigantea]